MLHEARKQFSDLPRGTQRLIIAAALFIDANYLGTLNGLGSLNILDKVLGGGLPNDMVWLLQLVESIAAGFVVVKVLFDDVPSGIPRTAAILLSPFFMVAITFFSLDILLQGLGEDASFTLDLVSISTGTLTWSSTYLAIAIGLTLTYKVQRYGNFAQSELFMIGMYLSMIMIWTDYFFPMSNLSTTKDGVLTWSVLLFTLIAAFVLTGIAGIIIDRLVYKGFRKTNTSPQVMMIASLGVALILRALTYLRFGASRNMFEPEGDWRMPNLRWEIPTTKLRFNLGERTLEDDRTYTHFNCEQTGVDEVTGEPILSRIVSDTSKPAFEIYDTTTDCVTQATTNYAYYKGAVPVVIFSAVLLLLLLLNKTRLGRRMRAVADNPELAASSGINVERVHLTSAFLSAGLSGMGGAIFALTLRFNPETAFTLLLPSFAIIVLGTIGSVPGAIVGSLIVGFVRALSSPVLIGIGMPLGRSNYSALDGVMPYIFLVAILMIMPEGIGDAYEKWKIERLRKRKEEDSDKTQKIAAALAIMPTGIFGLHHWWSNRTHRMQSFSAAAIAAYVFHRLSDFVGRNSFADGACADSCASSEFSETNLAVLTGRNDGTLLLEDSPLTEEDLLGQRSPPSELSPFEAEQWVADTVASMHESWFSMMNFEIGLVNFIVDLGDLIWPGAIIALWVYSIYEGIGILSDSESGNKHAQIASKKLQSLHSSLSDSISSAKLHILSKWSDFDRSHSMMVNRVAEQLRGASAASREKVSSVTSSASSSVLSVITRGSPDRKRKLEMYGRESPMGSWIFFTVIMAILLLFLLWLPIAESDDFRWKKVLQVSNVLVSLAIFILMAFSLNLHTGYTGMVNFGVIFFVGIGTITVGILTAPEELHGYGWGILPATIMGVALAAFLGWALAYPTARLRTDYFAIVTISLGEIVRVLLAGEPLLRVGAVGSAIGISAYPLPLENWWFCGSEESGPDSQWASPDACRDDISLIDTPANQVAELLNLGEPAPYLFILMVISLIAVAIVWKLLSNLLSSPWGRVLKAIREDEEVAQHHGHDILTHKAASLALGAGIAALAGAIWAWKLTGFEPTFMSPARSTFLVWAAFIIGGTSNNRGMVVGAFIIVLMEFVFNVLVAGQGSPDLPLHTTASRIDSLFEWIFTNQWEAAKISALVMAAGFIIRSERLLDLGASGAAIFSFGAIALGERSIEESFFSGVVSADMLYVKLMLIGCLMLFSLKFNSKGLLPEVPVRPERPTGGATSD
ncbi:MAG: ABC transporter permease [Candidatus Thermoplasmatota archaeon]|nr:ABC transporter permease [Candidatus Thermoplasmatota archaeon]